MSGALGTSSIPPVDPRLGAVLEGRYRLDRKIGEGGMGDVYEAEHLHLHKRVAVKILHVSYASRPDVLKRFQREAEAATRMQHPHIVEVTDLGRTSDGCPFMVLEYLEGKDLGRALDEDGPLPLRRIVHVVVQVCDALGVAHRGGIVHRDLKPENIFLCERPGEPDFVKLLDFGISKFQGDLSGAFPVTVTGAALGTPYYMSPEQVRGSRDVDARSDIWALGVILYRALSGGFPFDAESYPTLFLRICTDTPTPICTLREDLPLPFGEIVARMLAKDPAERFGSVDEIAVALAPYERDERPVKLRSVPPHALPPGTAPGSLGSRRAASFVETRDGSPSVDLAGFASAELDLPPPSASAPPSRPVPFVPEVLPTTGVSSSGSKEAVGAMAFAPAGSWLGDSIPPAPGPELDLAPRALPVVEVAEVTRPARRHASPPRSRGGHPASRGVGGGALYDVAWIVVGSVLCAIAAVSILVGVERGSSAFLGRADAIGLVRDGAALFFLGLAAWLVSGGMRRPKGPATLLGLVLWAAIAYGLVYGLDRALVEVLAPR